jgi:transposase
MQVVHERCCGIDVHKDTVVACVLIADATRAGGVQRETRSFGTLTGQLQALADWLRACAVRHVVMESTGVYWKPVYNLFEGHFEILVVNPERVKALKGKKTDVGDAEWLAELFRHGLLKGSFIPEALQREVRDLTRYRTTLTDEHTRFVNRVQKVLEDANIKLASVASNVMGQSARAMLAQLVAGNTDAAAMAELAKGRLRKKRELLEQALTGRVTEHHRFMLTQLLSQIDSLEEAIAELDERIAERMRPWEAAIQRWEQVPGFARRQAQNAVAELGPSLAPFEDAAHASSWSGLCPGNHESAGKHHSGKTRKGSKWVRRVFCEAAQAAARTKDSYFQAQYRHLVATRGKKRAILAVAHSLLVTGYYMITRQTDYVDLGANHYTDRDREGAKRRAVKKLEHLGYTVTLAPSAEASPTPSAEPSAVT